MAKTFVLYEVAYILEGFYILKSVFSTLQNMLSLGFEGFSLEKYTFLYESLNMKVLKYFELRLYSHSLVTSVGNKLTAIKSQLQVMYN